MPAPPPLPSSIALSYPSFQSLLWLILLCFHFLFAMVNSPLPITPHAAASSISRHLLCTLLLLPLTLATMYLTIIRPPAPLPKYLNAIDPSRFHSWFSVNLVVWLSNLQVLPCHDGSSYTTLWSICLGRVLCYLTSLAPIQSFFHIPYLIIGPLLFWFGLDLIAWPWEPRISFYPICYSHPRPDIGFSRCVSTKIRASIVKSDVP